jgi:hypothetical protein
MRAPYRAKKRTALPVAFFFIEINDIGNELERNKGVKRGFRINFYQIIFDKAF